MRGRRYGQEGAEGVGLNDVCVCLRGGQGCLCRRGEAQQGAEADRRCGYEAAAFA